MIDPEALAHMLGGEDQDDPYKGHRHRRIGFTPMGLDYLLSPSAPSRAVVNLMMRILAFLPARLAYELQRARRVHVVLLDMGDIDDVEDDDGTEEPTVALKMYRENTKLMTSFEQAVSLTGRLDEIVQQIHLRSDRMADLFDDLVGADEDDEKDEALMVALSDAVHRGTPDKGPEGILSSLLRTMPSAPDFEEFLRRAEAEVDADEKAAANGSGAPEEKAAAPNSTKAKRPKDEPTSS